jgi:hypothetical protein
MVSSTHGPTTSRIVERRDENLGLSLCKAPHIGVVAYVTATSWPAPLAGALPSPGQTRSCRVTPRVAWGRAARVAAATAAVVCAAVVSGAGAAPTAAPCRPRVQLLPTPRLSDTSLNGVGVSPGGVIWAVGSRYTGPDDALREESVILRWNGRRFVRLPSPSPRDASTNALHDVVAPADDAAWTVGANGVVRWDGQHWRQDVSQRQALFGISATGPDDVWAAGVPTTSWGGLLVMHWDGIRWKRVPFLRMPLTSRNVTPGYTEVIGAGSDDVLALAADDVWVVGTDAHKAPFSAHWNGKAWRSYPIPHGKEIAGPVSLAAGPHDDVWAAAGDRGLIVHWNGHRWLQRGQFKPSGNWAIPARSVAIRGDEVWAIVYIRPLTTVVRWNGSRWVRLYSSEKMQLNALAVDRNGDVLAIGTRGTGTAYYPVVLRYRCST